MTQGPPVLQGLESRSRRRRCCRGSFVSAHTAGSCTASVSQPRWSRQFCRDRLLCVLRSLPVSDRVGGRLRTGSSGKPTHWLGFAFFVFFPELSADALRGFLRKDPRLLQPLALSGRLGTTRLRVRWEACKHSTMTASFLSRVHTHTRSSKRTWGRRSASTARQGSRL